MDTARWRTLALALTSVLLLVGVLLGWGLALAHKEQPSTPTPLKQPIHKDIGRRVRVEEEEEVTLAPVLTTEVARSSQPRTFEETVAWLLKEYQLETVGQYQQASAKLHGQPVTWTLTVESSNTYGTTFSKHQGVGAATLNTGLYARINPYRTSFPNHVNVPPGTTITITGIIEAVTGAIGLNGGKHIVLDGQ